VGAERGNVTERFGERIRRIRTEQTLGLRELARKIGISPTYLSLIETSEEQAPPAEDVIRRMASQLGENFDELMTLAGRVSEASLDVIRADSRMPEFLRTVWERQLSAEDLMRLLPNEPRKGNRGF
jgi:transcriptional regulator with XRE-family HTH domain